MATYDLQTRAAILRQHLARKRAEQVRRSTLVVPAGRPEPIDDLTGLMGGYLVRDDGHSGTVWVGSVGLAPAGPDSISACPPVADGLHVGDGKRRKARTFHDRRYAPTKGNPAGRPRPKGMRLADGVALLDALLARRGGRAEPMPEHGFLPCAPVDTMAHGRSTATMAYREDCERLAGRAGRRFATMTVDGRTFEYDVTTGQVVTFEHGASSVGGDWRDPSTADRVRSTFPVPTGQVV